MDISPRFKSYFSLWAKSKHLIGQTLVMFATHSYLCAPCSEYTHIALAVHIHSCLHPQLSTSTAVHIHSCSHTQRTSSLTWYAQFCVIGKGTWISCTPSRYWWKTTRMQQGERSTEVHVFMYRVCRCMHACMRLCVCVCVCVCTFCPSVGLLTTVLW